MGEFAYLMKPKIGKVILVGAGPGDTGLLTLKGKEELERAQVVVYDWLVNPALLKHSPSAEKIFVGKKGGTRYKEQSEINQILFRLARLGKQVVRLKGGDPFIFGRGGEEASFLVQRKIPFEVVPGISAGIGAPAYAGIPLTDRRFASQVTFITGHEDPTKESSQVDWKKLAVLKGTLVSFMGARNLSSIVGSLVKAGKPVSTPVAVIEWGTFPHQRVVEGTLKNIVAKVRAVGIEAPALTIIGEVVKLRKKLAWFEKKSLHGKTVLVTRARTQASQLVRRLEEQGADVLEFPAIEILPPLNPEAIDREIENIRDYDWVIFTSTNGVKAFFGRMDHLKKDARIFSKNKVAAIGDATAQALLEKGIKPDLVPAEFTSIRLFEALKELDEIQGKTFLLARADIAPPDLKTSLEKEGASVVEIEAYRTRQVLEQKKELKGWLQRRKIDYITFTSSSTVDNFFKAVPARVRRKIRSKLISIGPVTSKTIKQYGFKPSREAKVHTIDGLVAAISKQNGNKS